MAQRSIVKSVVENDEPEDENDQVTVRFTEAYTDTAYEMMMDGYLCMGKEQVRDLRDQITDMLGDGA